MDGMRNRSDIEQVIDEHGNTVWRVCVLYFHQSPDAQDAFQETMLKYALHVAILPMRSTARRGSSVWLPTFAKIC